MKYSKIHWDFEQIFKSRNILVDDIYNDDEASLFPSEAKVYIQDGVLSYFVPKEFGGKFQNLLQVFVMGRCLARRNVSTAIAIGQSFLGSIPVWIEGSDSLKQRLAQSLKAKGANCLALTELEHGSDLLSSECSLSDNTLSGTKWCINNATLGASMSVLCRDGSGVSLVFIDKKNNEFKNLDKIKTHGIKGADISGIVFNSYPIAEEDIIGRSGRGLEIISKTMQISRTLCASFSLGASDSTLRDTIDFCFKRNLYDKSLLNISSVRTLLSKGLAKSVVCEALAVSATRMASFKPELMSMYASVVKSFIPVQIDEQIKLCSEILGGRYYLRENDYMLFQKNVRDHSVVSLFDGSLGVNLSLLHPILNKLEHFKKNQLLDENDFFNIDTKLEDFSFDHLKLSIRTYDFVISEFFKHANNLGAKYLSVNMLIERYDELIEVFDPSLESQSYAVRCLCTEFITIFSAMNFIMFCENNNILNFYKKTGVIDQIVLSLFEDNLNLSFGDDVFMYYQNHLISLFELEINQ